MGGLRKWIGRMRGWYRRHLKPLPSYCRLQQGTGVLQPSRPAPRLIVSLTSYPARIATVHQTVLSLLNQRCKPDKVVLWLGDDRFPNREKDLPPSLTALFARGLDVRWCRDLRSFTKFVHAFAAYPEDIVVTADDDILYPPEWLGMLYEAYRANPQAIHCHRVHRIRFSPAGEILPYLSWDYETADVRSTPLNFITGVGGVLYPPGVVPAAARDEEAFLRIVPRADDIWIWGIAVLHGIPIAPVPGGLRRCRQNPRADCSQALNIDNNGAISQNDRGLKAMFEAYPRLLEILEAAAKEREA